MMEHFARLERILVKPNGEFVRPELYLQLQNKAAEDNHAVIAPTHLVLKGEEVVGYVSINNLPMVLAWLSTKEMKARDSFSIINMSELLVQEQGWRSVCLPIDDTSPFLNVMPSIGYRTLSTGKVNLFVKELFK